MLQGKIGSTPITSRDAERASESTVGKRTLVEPSSPADSDPVQRKAAEAAPQGGAPAADLAARGTEGPGGPLPHLDRIQHSFGRHDVSAVQAHQGPAASAASHALGAQAFAYGGAVAFGSSPDLHTAAHEAAHVVQQRAGVQLKGGIDQPGDAYEQHADAVADAVVAGRSAAPLLDQMTGPSGGASAPASGGASAAVQRSGATAPAIEGGGGGAPQITPPTPGINGAGFIDHGDGANIRTGPAEAGGQTVRSEPLPPATRLFVSGTHPGAPDWHYVTAHLADGMFRGYVQGFRITTQLPEPLAELHQVVSGDTAESLAQRKFSHAVTDGRDLRFYENVLLHVNQQQGRAGVRGTYQDPNLVGGGANNIQLVAGHRIWLVSAAYALTLSNLVPDGSLTGGAVASARRFARHLEDILAAVNQSPGHVGEVAGEYAQAIMEHRVEIAGVVAAFLMAEMASAFLAATPTGVGQIAAAVIQLLLAFFGAQGMVMATLEAANHAGNWLNLGWTANGNAEQIAEASRAFVRMLVAIAVAALSFLGMRTNARNAVRIIGNIPPGGMAPALAVVGGGTRRGAGAAAMEGVAIGPGRGSLGVGGNAMMMNSDERPSSDRTPDEGEQPRQTEDGQRPDREGDTPEESWTPPRSWNGPRNHGRWTGARGNSGWVDSRPEVIRIVGRAANGEANPIPFRNGVVDFTPWSQGEFRVPGLTGNHATDMNLIRDALAERLNLLPGGSTSARRAAALDYLRTTADGYGGVGLRPHHAGGERIQLIPRDLHKVQHTDLSVYPLAE